MVPISKQLASVAVASSEDEGEGIGSGVVQRKKNTGEEHCSSDGRCLWLMCSCCCFT